jgi:hypothetical protein
VRRPRPMPASPLASRPARSTAHPETPPAGGSVVKLRTRTESVPAPGAVPVPVPPHTAGGGHCGTRHTDHADCGDRHCCYGPPAHPSSPLPGALRACVVRIAGSRRQRPALCSPPRCRGTLQAARTWAGDLLKVGIGPGKRCASAPRGAFVLNAPPTPTCSDASTCDCGPLQPQQGRAEVARLARLVPPGRQIPDPPECPRFHDRPRPCCGQIRGTRDPHVLSTGISLDRKLAFNKAFRSGAGDRDRANDGLTAAPADVRVALSVCQPTPARDPRFDPALAALVAHHLGGSGLPVPAWVGDSSRFLAEPWYPDEFGPSTGSAPSTIRRSRGRTADPTGKPRRVSGPLSPRRTRVTASRSGRVLLGLSTR